MGKLGKDPIMWNLSVYCSRKTVLFRVALNLDFFGQLVLINI